MVVTQQTTEGNRYSIFRKSGLGTTNIYIAGNGGKLQTFITISKTINSLQNCRKAIRFGVNDADILNKGFHLHFDDVVKNLEMGIVTLNEGKIGNG